MFFYHGMVDESTARSSADWFGWWGDRSESPTLGWLCCETILIILFTQHALPGVFDVPQFLLLIDMTIIMGIICELAF